MSDFLYKILRQEEWQNAKAMEAYAGSPDDIRDGFVHFSTLTQLDGTLAKYFSEESSVILLAFDPKLFGDSLKWEPSRGGEMFPHLYASLNVHTSRHTLTLKKPFDLSSLSKLDQA